MATPQTLPCHGLRSLLANAEDVHGCPLLELVDCTTAVQVAVRHGCRRVAARGVCQGAALQARSELLLCRVSGTNSQWRGWRGAVGGEGVRSWRA